MKIANEIFFLSLSLSYSFSKASYEREKKICVRITLLNIPTYHYVNLLQATLVLNDEDEKSSRTKIIKKEMMEILPL